MRTHIFLERTLQKKMALKSVRCKLNVCEANVGNDKNRNYIVLYAYGCSVRHRGNERQRKQIEWKAPQREILVLYENYAAG